MVLNGVVFSKFFDDFRTYFIIFFIRPIANIKSMKVIPAIPAERYSFTRSLQAQLGTGLSNDSPPAE
jgi:hypothetical protein